MILLIDNYDSFTYNLYQLITKTGAEVQVVRNDKISISEIEKLNPTGIVLSPGPGRPEKAGICIEIVKHFTGKLPIMGVCLGHQAIASAFGGKVIHANEIVHGKSAYVFHKRQDIYKNLPLPFEAARYHSLIVDRASLPSELEVVADNQDSVIMGLKHKQYPVFGVQFHPESILSDSGESLMQNFLALCKTPVEVSHAC